MLYHKIMYKPHHVALSVSNRERSVKFYNQLGFEQIHFWEAEDKSLAITHLKNDGLVLELFCFANPQPLPQTSHATATDLPIMGTKHFGLQVDSIKEAKKDLVAKGIVGADIQITRGKTNILYFFIQDPDGILVEIVEDKRGL